MNNENINDEILEIIKTKTDSFTVIIKAKYKDFYNKVNTEMSGEKFSEKLYKWFNRDKEKLGLCQLCNKPTKFMTFEIGYRKFCSSKCSNIASSPERAEKQKNKGRNLKFWEEVECEICKTKFWALKIRKQRFCSNKCSFIFSKTDQNRIDKIKQTKFEHYGDENYVNPDKAKKTNLERYGVDNPSKNADIINKIKEFNLKKYGVEYSWQSEIIKNKIKQTNLERYGSENPSSNEDVKEKRKETNLNKYGVDNCFKLTDKIEQTNLERYGVKHSSQNKDIIQKIINSNKLLTYERNKKRHEYKVEFLTPKEEFLGIDKSFLYKFRCKFCNNIFTDHLDGNGHPRCLTCFPYIQGFSVGEKELVTYIKELLPNDDILEKNRDVLGNRELDIYIPSKKLAIEFNGLYWHGEINGNKDKNYHLNKTVECNNLGIRLIHIFEDEWLYKSDIIKSRLKHILGLDNDNKIYARKCDIKTINLNDSNEFLEKTHIQGGLLTSDINLGLFYNNELVSVMTLGSPRLSMGNNEKINGIYELYRYATKYNIIGGASKLLSYFIKTYNPVKIISYADKRWNSGNLYEKIGFKFSSNTPPSYWYYKPGYPERHYRFGFRKDQLAKKLEIFDPNLTEWENMQNNGYDRIWDCGSIKYEWVG